MKPVIRVANDTAYGLSAAVCSQDITRALAGADKIESGICHINGPTVGDEAQMPFGGVKETGYGRFGWKAAIDSFTSCGGSLLRIPISITGSKSPAAINLRNRVLRKSRTGSGCSISPQ